MSLAEKTENESLSFVKMNSQDSELVHVELKIARSPHDIREGEAKRCSETCSRTQGDACVNNALQHSNRTTMQK